MKTFKDFISDYKTQKAGLKHPEDKTFDKNQPSGKDINSLKVPLEVQDEFKGKLGKHTLKQEKGKYKTSKEE